MLSSQLQCLLFLESVLLVYAVMLVFVSFCVTILSVKHPLTLTIVVYGMEQKRVI